MKPNHYTEFDIHLRWDNKHGKPNAVPTFHLTAGWHNEGEIHYPVDEDVSFDTVEKLAGAIDDALDMGGSFHMAVQPMHAKYNGDRLALRNNLAAQLKNLSSRLDSLDKELANS